ncbi:hypothetical protein QTP70_024447, partial [Hemibagrus guttatus]
TNTSGLTVYLGKQTLNGSNPNQIARGVNQVTLHPNYNSTTFNNDIALLLLNSSVTFTNYIRPVCLAAQSSSFPAGTNSWVTGWGDIAFGGSVKNPCDDTPQACTQQQAITQNLACHVHTAIQELLVLKKVSQVTSTPHSAVMPTTLQFGKAVLTSRCRVLRSKMVQFPNQAVMQLLWTLSMVPL